MKKTLCAVILGLTSFSAFSYDGNDLYDWGREWKADKGEGFKAGTYAGFVLGVNSSWTGLLFCPPKQTRNEQLFDIVLEYLKSKPAKRTDAAAKVVIDALGETYPCSKK